METFPVTGGCSEETKHMSSSPSLGRGQILGAVSDCSQKPIGDQQRPWLLQVPFHCSDFFWAYFQHRIIKSESPLAQLEHTFSCPLQPVSLHQFSSGVLLKIKHGKSEQQTPLGYSMISIRSLHSGTYSIKAHMPPVIIHVSNTEERWLRIFCTWTRWLCIL